ncbi:MAG: alpha/beta hydrolase, partial [bacterium]|nr:alpha/beta hydrolase [bacterium]
TGGTAKQFYPQSAHLANRGMLAATADYRIKSLHGVTPFECVADAKSAVRWMRAHAAELGIDPDRIAAGGGSAGGHLAACTALIDDLDTPGEDMSVSSRPNALVLFNPALVLAFRPGMDAERLAHLTSMFQGREKEISPIDHMRPGAPPTLIQHGKDDTTVPFASMELFRKAMQADGNRCDLIGYEGQQHGFFNAGRGNNEMFRQTLAAADNFLVDLGFLKPAKATAPAQ